MRVSARGYNRDSGSRTIFDEEITDAVVEEEGKSGYHKSNILYVKKMLMEASTCELARVHYPGLEEITIYTYTLPRMRL
jgi:hypothetical protein